MTNTSEDGKSDYYPYCILKTAWKAKKVSLNNEGKVYAYLIIRPTRGCGLVLWLCLVGLVILCLLFSLLWAWH